MLRELSRESPVTRRLERFNWRLVFFGVLWIAWKYVGWRLGNHEPPRPEGETALLVAAWITTLALYGWLSLGQGRSSPAWTSNDAFLLAMMMIATVYTAFWPAIWVGTRPAGFAGIVATAGLGSALFTPLYLRRQQANAAAAEAHAEAPPG